MTTDQVRVLGSAQVAALTSDQLTKLTADQIVALTTAQVASFTTQQIQSLTTDQLNARIERASPDLLQAVGQHRTRKIHADNARRTSTAARGAGSAR